MKTLIVVPAYNEGENLKKVTEKLNKYCSDADYIIINDGSTDNTSDICRLNSWPFIDLPVNLGLAGAFQTGMRYAFLHDYDTVVQFDGDGQHDAECTKRLIDEMNSSDADILIGSRFVNEKKPATMRMLGSNLISFAIKLTTGKKINDPTSGQRLYSKRIIKVFANNINYGPEPDTVAYLIRMGAQVKETQVIMHEREAGQSYLTAAKSIRYMMNMFISILFVQFFRKGNIQ